MSDGKYEKGGLNMAHYDPKLLAVNCSLLAGQLLIENGANMERVNDTMYRIAENAGLHSFQAFTTVTGIVVSAEHQSNAQAVDIRARHNDLSKVARVNEISRQFATKEINLSEMYNQLKRVDKGTPQLSVFTQCIGAAVLSLSLMIVFTGDVRDSWAAFIIGGTCYWMYLYLLWKFKVKYMGEFVSSLLIGLLAIMTTKLGWTSNLNDIIIGSVMPLVPGVPLTNAARDLVSGNLISGPTRALEAIITAMAIGCAIVIVLRYA